MGMPAGRDYVWWLRVTRQITADRVLADVNEPDAIVRDLAGLSPIRPPEARWRMRHLSVRLRSSDKAAASDFQPGIGTA